MADATFGSRLQCIMVIALPIIGLIAGIIMLWGPGIQPIHLALMLGGYILTGHGITIGYHRLFTHKSFKTSRFMTFIIALLGTMAWEGPIMRWVGTHRMHHQHSDNPLDPHSPHTHGDHALSFWKGLWHSHMGWIMFSTPAELSKYTPDLRKDKMLVWFDRFFLPIALLGLVIPGLIAWAVTGTLMGGLLGFIWGGLVRVFLVHHITWSVNSACHLWGAQHFKSHDHSRNNAVFGVLAFGEGWHNNHHAFPASARHGLKWYQFDSSYLVIRAMKAVGLASDVIVPSAQRQAEKAI